LMLRGLKLRYEEETFRITSNYNRVCFTSR
jgi:hypothetical protein